jgi:hypothetical protein
MERLRWLSGQATGPDRESAWVKMVDAARLAWHIAME